MLADGAVVAERSQPGSRDLAVSLLPLVRTVLADGGCSVGEVGLIAVSSGPGSFTGLRVGMSTAKGLAMATGCAVVSVPTLEALAAVAVARSGLLCPVLDARKGEVYGGVFRNRGGRLQRMVADAAATPESFAAAVSEPCVLLGDGVEVYRQEWGRLLPAGSELLPFAEFHPRGAVVAELGLQLLRDHGSEDLAALVPRYCRAPEAQVRRAADGGRAGRTGVER